MTRSWASLPIDGAADFGDPQPDAVVLEQGEREAELVAIEGALWFADDHGVEASVRIAERGEQAGRLGSAFPRQ